MSPWMKRALALTPAWRARFSECCTSATSNSTPNACAPRFAAAITIRPSPEPRS
jgi:hypothetical protein